MKKKILSWKIGTYKKTPFQRKFSNWKKWCKKLMLEKNSRVKKMTKKSDVGDKNMVSPFEHLYKL